MKKKMLKQLGEVRRFFREDPLGQKLIDQFQDLVSIAKAIRQRIRKRLGEYLKGLENE